jgi:heat shock protein HslJ
MNDGSVVTRQVTVYVTPVAGAPTISQFSMTPPSPITLSQCVTLQWSVQGDVTRVLLSRNNQPVWDAAPYQGSFNDCPPSAGQYTYVLQATGPGGTSQANQFLQVNTNQPTSTPVPPTSTPVPPTSTPVPPTSTPVPQPEITSFSVQPGQIQQGQCVTIDWTTGSGTVSVDITRRGALILDNGPLSGSIADCPAGPGGIDYQITASNQAGATVSQNATITVVEPPPPTDTPAPPPLSGNWNLVSLIGSPLAPNTAITASFNNGQLSGSGGCNTYNASYSTSGNSISIGFPTATQMFCEDYIIQQESIYFNSLASAASYQLSGSTLSMYDGGGQLILQYTP